MIRVARVPWRHCFRDKLEPPHSKSRRGYPAGISFAAQMLPVCGRKCRCGRIKPRRNRDRPGKRSLNRYTPRSGLTNNDLTNGLRCPLLLGKRAHGQNCVGDGQLGKSQTQTNQRSPQRHRAIGRKEPQNAQKTDRHSGLRRVLVAFDGGTRHATQSEPSEK